MARALDTIPTSIQLDNALTEPLVAGAVRIPAGASNLAIDLSKLGGEPSGGAPVGPSEREQVWNAIASNSKARNSGLPITVDSTTPSVTLGADDWAVPGAQPVVTADTFVRNAGSGIPLPAITGISILGTGTTQDVIVTFNTPIRKANGTAIGTGDITLAFAQNGGAATNAVIASLTKIDGATALDVNDTVVRINLTITGTPNGLERLTVTQTTNVYNQAGQNNNAQTAVVLMST